MKEKSKPPVRLKLSRESSRISAFSYGLSCEPFSSKCPSAPSRLNSGRIHPHNGKSVASGAVGNGLHDREINRCRNRGIDRISSLF